jgi:membrane fusion protein, multidrug efflux system
MAFLALRIKRAVARRAFKRAWLPFAFASATLVLLSACHKESNEIPKVVTEVSVMTVTQRDTPVDFEFTAQTESSREVQIRARVDGFLDKRVYSEGQPVRAGQTMFLMDPKPFEATLQSAKGELAQQQARLTVTKANLARVLPLVAQNALSQKDKDDAIGNEKEAEAAVLAAKGQVQTAELNLSYRMAATSQRQQQAC